MQDYIARFGMEKSVVVICYFTRPAILHACFQYSKVCGSIEDDGFGFSGQTSGVVNLDSNHVDSI